MTTIRDWLDVGMFNEWIAPPSSTARTMRLLSDVACIRSSLPNLALDVASLMREASDLAEQLAPDLPWSTDEPTPDLTPLDHRIPVR
jgi:hypothetical protein